MSDPLHVIVVGGGIGGLCLAQGLTRAGMSVAVHERDRTPTERPAGYRIHLNPAGSRALHACLPPARWQEFVATAGEPGGLGFLTERLDPLLVISDADLHDPGTDPAERSHAVDRATLRRLLLNGLDDVVTFDKTFTHYEQHGDTVTAFFADGTSATGDLLVGADGVSSRVQRQFLPDAPPLASEALSVASRLPLTPDTRAWLPERLATSMNMIVAPDPYFLFTSAFVRRDPNTDGYVLCAFITDPTALPVDVGDLAPAALQDLVAARVAHWHPDLRRMITDADQGSFSVQPHRASVPVPPWRPTTVTLLGDALHAMPPVGGLGGNAALRDAHLLTRTLLGVARGDCGLTDALGIAETEMRAHGFAAVRRALLTQRQGLRAHPVAVGIARTWFRAAHRFPRLRRATVPFREQARPRPWERDAGVVSGVTTGR